MHRVMDHPGKCAAIHGHTYLYEIQIDTKVGNIGYGIDFADVKQILQYYIDGYLDHGAILNPADVNIIDLCKNMKSKYHVMSTLEDNNKYMNPSAENIAREMYYTLDQLLIQQQTQGYNCIHNIRLYETPNCYVDFNHRDTSEHEKQTILRNKSVKRIIDSI